MCFVRVWFTLTLVQHELNNPVLILSAELILLRYTYPFRWTKIHTVLHGGNNFNIETKNALCLINLDA